MLAPTAKAQVLGVLETQPVIGRPLDARLPLQLDERAGSCVRAEVAYGDTKLPIENVHVSVSGVGSARVLHVRTDVAVDEPVVTLSVRAGCSDSASRSYTLLPAFGAPPALAAAAPPAAVQRNPAPAVQRNSAPVARLPLPEERPRQLAAARPARSSAPRLKLEAWEPDAQTALRASSTLSAPQGEAARAAAASLWQALNADPAQLLRSQERLQQLEKELSDLRQANARTHDDIAALRRELEAPPASISGQHLLVLGAGLLAIAAALAGAFVWARHRRPVREWSGAPLQSTFDDADAAPLHSAAREPVEPVLVAPPPQEFVPSAPQEEVRHGAPPAAAPAPGVQAMQPPSTDARRVEALAAAFEEVDLLRSVGAWNDAIDALMHYLRSSATPAPLAFFELIRLCAHIDDAGGVAAVRERYLQQFGMSAPTLDSINAPRGIDAYPGMAAYLEQGGEPGEMLALIDHALFTAPPADQAFSLQAGRELLSLHHMTAAELEEDAPGEDNVHEPIAPWVDAPGPAAPELPEPTGGFRFSLDLDLDAMVNAEAVRDGSEQTLELAATGKPRAPAPEPMLVFDADAFDSALGAQRMRPTEGRA